MKFICNKQDLQLGINTVIRATYNKFHKSILECIHIVAEEKLSLDAFDTVTAIKTNVYAEVLEKGETAIPARILQEIINKFPEGEISFERKGENSISISSANSHVTLQEMDAAQFPAFPELEGDAFAIRQDELKRLIEKTAFSAYMGEDKPVFTGLLFETEEESISAVAIDGIRMAKNTVHRLTNQNVRAIIPAKSLREVARILPEDDSEISMAFNNNACFINMENTSIYTRLLEGEFMNYRSIIHKSYKTRVRVDAAMLQNSLEMVSVLAREDSSNLIRMTAGQNAIELCSNSEYGVAVDQIPAEVEGEMLKIAFNAKYLLDIFKVIEEQSVFMEFNDSLKPCIIKPIEGDSYLYIVVPVNVKN